MEHSFDMVFLNGALIDPGSKRHERVNVGVKNGKVAAISANPLEGAVVYDIRNRVLSPGFIDGHMHEGAWDARTDTIDMSIFENMIRMGVTTAVGGNCGIGPGDPAAYLERVHKKIPINLKLLIPHGMLREQAGQPDKYKPLDESQLARLEELLRFYVAKGCFAGVSLGIMYMPGIDATELDRVASLVPEGGILAAHIRDVSKNVFDATEEVYELGRRFRMKVQISHIGSMAGYGQMERVLQLFRRERENGNDVWADCYPYNAFSTMIGATTYDGDFLSNYGATYDALEIAEGPYKGRKLDDALLGKIRAEAPDTLTIAHFMREEDVDMALKDPNVLISSDGLVHHGQGHPRAAGSFPRLLSLYVREKKLLSLYEAIEKITWLAARRFGIPRGRLAVGDVFDAVVFDPDAIRDGATFAEPALPPTGIDYVFVNGALAAKDGQLLEEGRHLGVTKL